MSYHWVPIFVCGLCGKAEPSRRWENVPFGFRYLPDRWTGSERKRGECYCDECTNAIERIKGKADE